MMTFKELKEIVNCLPDYLDDTEVTMTKIEQDGFGDSFPLDKVVYGAEVVLWSNYHDDN